MGSADVSHLLRDESGSVILEFTASFFVLLVFLFGVVEFSYVFYQWNAAAKAVQRGARIAAVSEPVSVNFRSISGVGGTVKPGDPMPSYDYTCTKGTTNCDNNALNLIVFGRCDTGESCSTVTINGSSVKVRTACNPSSTPANAGMCNMFPRINDTKYVKVRYEQTGLGYAGRPGGPVPTITVELTGLSYNFVLLSMLLGSVSLPSFATTVTGEDLNATWSS